MKSQKVQLMRIVEDLTLQLRATRFERSEVQEAAEIAVKYH
jgi:hypothetical protein